ncbi:conserved membrane hypothetical protein [Burkholderia sp. 8Y]|nr:conserved membrane hypothetical protein [Burkholderia sp. 8Y]
MNIYAIWPYFGVVAAVLVLFSLPLWSFVDEKEKPDAPHRVASIGGLRGILTLSVAVHHVVTSYKYHLDGVWGWLPSGFYNQLGEASVSLFFMVTGYLFWHRLVTEDGRTDFVRLYIGRLFRIAPMYIVVVCLMFAVVAHRTHWELRVPFGQLVRNVAQWLSLGIAGSRIPLNGDEHATLVLAGVTWTIGYEWAFYAALPMLFVVARRSIHLPFALLSFYAMLCISRPGLGIPGFAALFCGGMLSASLVIRGLRATSRTASLIAIAALTLSIASSPSTYGHSFQIFGLAVFFAIVSSGNTLFGLLSSRPAERLGNISYSVYLLQGLAITAMYGLPIVRGWAFMSPAVYWVSAALCCALLTIGSTFTYVIIERPFMSFGKRLAKGAPSFLVRRRRSEELRRKPAAASRR